MTHPAEDERSTWKKRVPPREEEIQRLRSERDQHVRRHVPIASFQVFLHRRFALRTAETDGIEELAKEGDARLVALRIERPADPLVEALVRRQQPVVGKEHQDARWLLSPRHGGRGGQDREPPEQETNDRGTFPSPAGYRRPE